MPCQKLNRIPRDGDITAMLTCIGASSVEGPVDLDNGARACRIKIDVAVLAANRRGIERTTRINQAVDGFASGSCGHGNRATCSIQCTCVADELGLKGRAGLDFKQTIAIKINRCRITGSQMDPSETGIDDARVQDIGRHEADKTSFCRRDRSFIGNGRMGIAGFIEGHAAGHE